MASTVAAKKAKGRRLQNRIAEKIMACFPSLREGDVKPAIMGESGVDIILSPAARDLLPLSIEAKNQETASIWAWIKQAEANAKVGTFPAVVFARNRSDDYVVLRLDDLLSLLAPQQPNVVPEAEPRPIPHPVDPR